MNFHSIYQAFLAFKKGFFSAPLLALAIVTLAFLTFSPRVQADAVATSLMTATFPDGHVVEAPLTVADFLENESFRAKNGGRPAAALWARNNMCGDDIRVVRKPDRGVITILYERKDKTDGGN